MPRLLRRIPGQLINYKLLNKTERRPGLDRCGASSSLIWMGFLFNLRLSACYFLIVGPAEIEEIHQVADCGCVCWHIRVIFFCDRVGEIVPAARANRPEFPVMFDKL